MMTTPSTYAVAFTTEGLDPRTVQVRRLATQERLSHPYVVELDIEARAVEPRAWILEDAQVVILDAHDGTVARRYAGIVTRVRERATRRADLQRIAVTIESPLAKLRLVRDHRIFQNQTTRDIVSTVLAEAGIDASRTAFRLAGTYVPREVCTQFGEDALSFVSRLLEEDGIFFFAEHHEDGALLVFGDSGAAYAALDPTKVAYVPESGMLACPCVHALVERERIRPAKVTLRDHDFKRPALNLETTAEDGAPLGREHYSYPGRYVDPTEGARRSRLRLDAFAAEASGIEGMGTVLAFAPGHRFTLSGAPDVALDREYVVCDVAFAWEEGRHDGLYRNRFTLLSAAAPYRPLARTPRAVVPGPQVARVAGPPGEEIHCDEFGRVKVLFPWDRRGVGDEKSSAWVRVGQMHTSGAVAIPRAGAEVLIEFEEGDPDRPIIVGRLFTGKDGPPYPLPTHKTRSVFQSNTTPGGGGSNEIHLEDRGGGEQLHTYAQKDATIVTAVNRTEKVATNATHAVGADHTVLVGASEEVIVGANHQAAIGASQTWSVGGSREKSVGGAEKIDIAGSRSLAVGGSHTTMTPLTATTNTAGSLSETVGGSAIEAAALGVAMAAAGAASVTVGGAKIEAVATGKSDATVGAKATTIGGAFISASGKDVGVSVGGAKATTVGGAFAAVAGGDVELSSGASLKITVGGMVALNGAKVVLRVGGSKLSVGMGGVALVAPEIKLIASGPQPELAALVGDK